MYGTINTEWYEVPNTPEYMPAAVGFTFYLVIVYPSIPVLNRSVGSGYIYIPCTAVAFGYIQFQGSRRGKKELTSCRDKTARHE